MGKRRQQILTGYRGLNIWRTGQKLFWSYWRTEERKKATLLLGAIIILNLLSVYLLVLLNDWYNDFYNALQVYDYARFWPLIGYFALLAFIYIALAVYAIYLCQVLQINWRQRMTRECLSLWLKGKAYYHLERTASAQENTTALGTDNPDQRISEDVSLFAELSLSLFVGFLKALSTLIAFAVVLWHLSSNIALPFGGQEIYVPGYMLWVSMIYSIVGTYLAHRAGRRLISLSVNQQHYEADFRFAMMRARENAESIAFYGGEREERRGMDERFALAVKNFWGLMRQTKILNFYSNSYAQLAIIVPLLLAAPGYFSGVMALGGLMQTISAFGRVQDSMSYFVDSYASIANLAAVTRRLGGFAQHMEAASQTKGQVTWQEDATGNVTLEALTVSLPAGETLLQPMQAKFMAGQKIIVTGASGAGKSTLLRALAGLWPFAKGKVSLPQRHDLLFLPQRPYLPLGTLAKAVAYPDAPEGRETEIHEVLQAVGLGKLQNRLTEVADWSHILSLGEQQRVAFARILLRQPRWAFLDEATSALDEKAERELYALLCTRLPQLGLTSVAHREELRAFHERELHLDGAGGFTLKDLNLGRQGA